MAGRSGGRFIELRLTRPERAELLGKPGGQHRHDRFREVDARTAPERVRVDAGPRADVVAHIGDVNRETEATVQRLRADGVVEVARIHRIDRDRRERTQVAPVRLGAEQLFDRLIARGRILQRLRLLQHVFGELGRQVEFAFDNAGVDQRIVGLAENLEDLGPRHAAIEILTAKAEEHLEARNQVIRCMEEREPRREQRVCGDQREAAPGALHGAEQPLGRAFDHALDPPFGKLLVVIAAQADLDEIAMHRITEMAPGDVDVRDVLAGAANETETPAVHAEDAASGLG